MRNRLLTPDGAKARHNLASLIAGLSDSVAKARDVLKRFQEEAKPHLSPQERQAVSALMQSLNNNSADYGELASFIHTKTQIITEAN